MAKSDKGEKKPTSQENNLAPRSMSRDTVPVRDPARDSALSRAVQQIEKQFGKGAVMKLDGEARATVDGIPTGRCRSTSRSAELVFPAVECLKFSALNHPVKPRSRFT